MRWIRSIAALVWLAGAPALAGVTAWVPLEVRDGHVLFPVEVAGVAGYAMFDTGSQTNSISTALVEKAGLKLTGPRYQIRGVSSTDQSVRSVASLSIELFGVAFKLRDVPALPHSEEMIIGAGFLKAAVLQLDYPNNRMRLIARDSLDLDAAANVPMRLEDASGLPAVQVTIDGKERWMLFDTGNTGPLMIRRLIARDERWIERFQRASGEVSDINADTLGVDLLVLPSVEIGPYELTDVPVAVPAEGESAYLSSARARGPLDGSRIRRGVKTSGIVGYELLRHFVVTVDYEREKMHLQAPPETPAESAQQAAAGDPAEAAHAEHE